MTNLVEWVEAFRIAVRQIAANRTRSILTALGVVIGIVAVTLMGTAINGIDTGFDRSMSGFGDDVSPFDFGTSGPGTGLRPNRNLW
jgi:putative ABC transport system permease protein